ncbi:U3 small nucleolar RNA-associated protein [Serendipita sp. 399]|nr:U3 small nucleolar RNA-associated protein [Serendipita sp. 399]
MPPLLVSAGLDMSIAISPCAPAGSEAAKTRNPFSRSSVSTFQDAYYHKSAFVSPVVSIAPLARLLACRYDDKVAIWRIKSIDDASAETPENAEGWTKLLDMSLKLDTNLNAIALSEDGSWLAVSNEREVKLFSLIQKEESLRARRIRVLPSILQSAFPHQESVGASVLTFSPDSKKLVIGVVQGGYVAVLSVGEEPRVLRTFDQHRQPDPRTRSLRSRGLRRDEMEVDDASEAENETGARISRLAVSPDGQWLASSDLNGRTYVFNLDSLQLHCTLPTMPLPLTCMAFDHHRSRLLFVAMPDNSVRIFDVESKAFPEWQRTFSQTLSRKLGSKRDEILGIAMLPLAPPPLPLSSSASTITESPMFAKNATMRSTAQGVVVWGANWICRFRVQPVMTTTGREKRRRGGDDDDDDNDDEDKGEADEEMEEHESDEDSGSMVAPDSTKEDTTNQKTQLTTQFHLVDRYRSLLGVFFLNSEELVMVERPLLDVLSTLPPAFFKAKYGT